MGRANREELRAAGKHVWNYAGTKADWCRRLDAERQPWVIVRYPIRAKFVEGESVYCYEIVIFQTYDREQAIDSLTMDKFEFYDVIRELGLKRLYDGGKYGVVYGRDDRLKALYKAYDGELSRLRAEALTANSELTRLNGIIRLKANAGKGVGDLLEKKKHLEAVIAASEDDFGKFRKKYYKTHKIIIYQIF